MSTMKAKAPKAAKAWAVYDSQAEEFYVRQMAGTKREAIKRTVAWFDGMATWPVLYRAGCRCIAIRISPLTLKRKAAAAAREASR